MRGKRAHGPENIYYRGWRDFRSSGITACPADFDGLAGRDRRLGGADVGELDRSRRRRGLSYFGLSLATRR